MLLVVAFVPAPASAARRSDATASLLAASATGAIDVGFVDTGANDVDVLTVEPLGVGKIVTLSTTIIGGVADVDKDRED